MITKTSTFIQDIEEFETKLIDSVKAENFSRNPSAANARFDKCRSKIIAKYKGEQNG